MTFLHYSALSALQTKLAGIEVSVSELRSKCTI